MIQQTTVLIKQVLVPFVHGKKSERPEKVQ
jgi:hypothetical protein